MIRDKIDKILDSLPEEELKKVYWSISSIQEEYLFNKNLQEKGVTVTTLVEEAEEIIDLWDRTFAKDISEEVKKEIYYDQFKWHIFSYEKKDCLKDDDARKAFDALPKEKVYVMYQGLPLIYLYTNANKVEAKVFDSQQDIYIFDTNFTWTYVRTHELMCGPYFYKVNEMS
ncbi:DUF4275 family protein [Calidifontibacillus erzurumensis]|uniref:DUF4275 family protein n=1 Tax=Calidifontibacillus erzurumensis TaxID=2741433 RepID=A0A8J8GGW6_9BACI|nr:DUF4275 family protein [Calidifontibacillus erzurumensis]NSL52173.1 DUF4275 family protein [Calidifontibacillus erzurumensis]